MTQESATFDLVFRSGCFSLVAVGEVWCLWVIASVLRSLSQLISPGPPAVSATLPPCYTVCTGQDTLWHECSSHTITYPDVLGDKVKRSVGWHFLSDSKMTRWYSGGRGGETDTLNLKTVVWNFWMSDDWLHGDLQKLQVLQRWTFYQLEKSRVQFSALAVVSQFGKTVVYYTCILYAYVFDSWQDVKYSVLQSSG